MGGGVGHLLRLETRGTQAYSSEAQPESSSEMEGAESLRLADMMRSRSTGTMHGVLLPRGIWCWQIFLRGRGWGQFLRDKAH